MVLRKLFLLFGLVFVLSSVCFAEEKTNLEDVKKETSQLLKTLKEYSIEQRDKAINETQKQSIRLIDDLNV